MYFKTGKFSSKEQVAMLLSAAMQVRCRLFLACRDDCAHSNMMMYGIHSQKGHMLVASCQFYRLVVTCQQVATNLSLSSTCHLHTCYNLLIQLPRSLLMTNFDNQRATSLLTTSNKLACWQLATDFFSQAVASHANASWYRLVVTILISVVVRCQQTCWHRFWLCMVDNGG